MEEQVNNKASRTLESISWKVPESVYRADDALSYSLLAKYERGGFNELEHLFDKVESPSLTFGSVVDCLMTDGEEDFKERFAVTELPVIPDSIERIVTLLFNDFGEKNWELTSIPDSTIIEYTTRTSYQLNWKPETRAKVIKEKGYEYYKGLFLARGKTLVSNDMYNDAVACVDVLKHSNATSTYFTDNNDFDPIKRYYQLKFKATFNNINYRCMMDLALVDEKNLTIQPIDLKTSSHFEWDFPQSFLQWSYAIQARLYTRILADNTKRDSIFKNYKILPYLFIVVNKKTLTPLVWRYNDSSKYGDIAYGKNHEFVCRDPFDIAEELSFYLNNKVTVPKDIKKDEINDLDYRL